MSEEKLTMDDFSAELEASFKKIEEGDMLTGTVISVDEKEVILDLKILRRGRHPRRGLQQRAWLLLKRRCSGR